MNGANWYWWMNLFVLQDTVGLRSFAAGGKLLQVPSFTLHSYVNW